MLQELRDKLDKIDKEIAILFNDRMDIVKLVTEYKLNNNIQIHDKQRESDMIDKNSLNISEEYKEYYIELLNSVLKSSKDYQRKIINE